MEYDINVSGFIGVIKALPNEAQNFIWVILLNSKSIILIGGRK
jgi:hypothetical protein